MIFRSFAGSWKSLSQNLIGNSLSASISRTLLVPLFYGYKFVCFCVAL